MQKGVLLNSSMEKENLETLGMRTLFVHERFGLSEARKQTFYCRQGNSAVAATPPPFFTARAPGAPRHSGRKFSPVAFHSNEAPSLIRFSPLFGNSNRT